MDDLLQFLGSSDEDKLDVQIGGEFSPTGFVGPWVAEVLYTLASEAEYSREEIGYDISRKLGGWSWYYWKNAAIADKARDVMGSQYGASTEWVWRVATAGVINFQSDETRAKFGPDLFYSTRVAGWGSKKYRHEFGLVSLPAAVATIADLQGLDTPGFPLDTLQELDGDSSEDACVNLIGGVGAPWEESVLGKQRAELWEALGEGNVKASRPMGSLTAAGKPDKQATVSSQLDACLRIFFRAWTQPAWAQVIPVPDPRPDAISGSSGNRLSLPALTAIFRNEAEAILSLPESGTTSAPASAAATSLPIPAIWKNYPDQWKSLLDDVMSKVGKKPLPTIYEESGKDEVLGCTLGELQAWIEHLQATT